jgi:2-keto-4-pentenoate hydratase
MHIFLLSMIRSKLHCKLFCERIKKIAITQMMMIRRTNLIKNTARSVVCSNNPRYLSTTPIANKTYAGLSKEEVERNLREQGIVPSGNSGHQKRKVKISKWVNPIFNKPVERELKKPIGLGSDINRKIEIAMRILSRPFLEEQKTEEYRNELSSQKSSQAKELESKIIEEQKLKADRLKKGKNAFSSERDTTVYVRLFPTKLLPADEHEAVLFQRELIKTLLAVSEQQQKDPEFSRKYKHTIALKGWKVGASQPKVQSTLGLEKPFVGPIFNHQVYSQKDSHTAIQLRNTIIGQISPNAECEFAFVFKKALPAREPGSEPYTREQVAEAIGSVVPAMEIVGSRIEDVGDQSKEFFLRIADCGAHVALLLGSQSIENPTLEDLENLAHSKVVFSMNEDEQVIHGQGNYVYNGQVHKGSDVGPLDTTTWAVNDITAPESDSGRGMSIDVGTIISSGTMTGKSRPIDYGDHISATFSSVPSISTTVGVSAQF